MLRLIVIAVIVILISYMHTVSGAPALPHKYPYHVDIRSFSNIHKCGGVLITPSIVLTTARCVNDTNPTNMQILAAKSSKQQNHVTSQPRNVKEVIVYEAFDPKTLEHDIALVILTAELQPTMESYFVKIPNTTIIFKENATLIGWADRKAVLDGNSPESVLYVTKMSILSKEDCARETNSTPSNSQLCAETVGNGACISSWCGHLECAGKVEAKFLCGIYSWGNGCGSFPAIFTNIAWYRTWIQSIAELRPKEVSHGAGNVTLSGCPANGFECQNTKNCISSDYVCDGELDCGGGDQSDEEGCRAVNGCHKSQFACQKGNKCLYLHKRCDGHVNCFDRSDEENCAEATRSRDCAFDEFQCNATKMCVPQKYLCDGVQNCGEADLSDEEGCGAALGCHPSQFACHLGNRCIPQYQKCDNTVDCPDESDEHACDRNHTCDIGALPCSIHNSCYGLANICDGIADCGDYDLTDETNCTTRVHGCPWTHFACRNGQCVQGINRCDGKEDCKDGSDEDYCKDKSCHWTQFACLNDGKCVRNSYRCDGEIDCRDGSDEENCGDPKCCHWSQFACHDRSACLPGHFKCDGRIHCGDGSDEDMCKRNVGCASVRWVV